MFEIERTVGSSHLGSDKTVRLSAIVDFMQDCCGFQLDNDKTLSTYFKEHGVIMFLISRQLHLHRPIYYGENLIIRTWIYGLRASHGYRNTMIYSDKGELLVSCYAGGAFIKAETAKATGIPENIRNTIRMTPKFPDMDYLPRKITLPKEDGLSCCQMPVYKHYIDENKHVNNARYLDIAEEFIPEDFSVKDFRVEYKTAAKRGDIIFPIKYIPSPDCLIISLTDGNGRVFVNTEFRS